MRLSSLLRFSAVALFGLGFCGLASAEHSRALDRVSVWLGGTNVDASADLENNYAETGSLGKLDLGKGNQSLARARVDFLLFESQGFSVDYYSFSRSKDRVSSGQFDYEGVPFDLTANLRSDFDLDLGSATYHWWFGSGDDVFGVGIGAAYYRAKLSLVGSLAVDGGTPVTAQARWSDSAVAPVLTLGYRHAFSDSVRLYATASGVRKNGGDLSGHIYEARLGVEWFPWQNFGVAAEYGTNDLSIHRNRQSSSSTLETDFHGPSLFARLRF